MSGDAVVPSSSSQEVSFVVPTWCGRPPTGFHLDVMKGDKLIQKLLIDEKKCYYFGRNPTICDFTMDHQSCSRVHAALVYHKFLCRFFLVDLGSAHGTFIGRARLESDKPEQLQVDQAVTFGASSRRYVLRARPGAADAAETDAAGRPLPLPDKDDQLDNLTEYNTALNRRVATMAIPEDELKAVRKRKLNNVNFYDEDEIINPGWPRDADVECTPSLEDVDPTVGRFRNLVHMAVIPKRCREGDVWLESVDERAVQRTQRGGRDAADEPTRMGVVGFGPLSAKLGLSMPNPAPDVDALVAAPPPPPLAVVGDEPRKKKYPKEHFPGK